VDFVISVASSKKLRFGSRALLVSSLDGSISPSDVVLEFALATQVEQMQGCLERAESFLERAEAALSRLFALPAMLKTTAMSGSPSEVGVGSVEDRGAELNGCFSPHVGDYSSLSTLSFVSSTLEGEAIATVVAPLVHIMPEHRELCTCSALPLSVEHKKVDSPTTLSSPEQSDEVSAPIPPSMLDNPDALFFAKKKPCDILSSLQAVIP
jgi:hypothetical protein